MSNSDSVKKVTIINVRSFETLQQELEFLKGQESLTVVHYSTDWTEEKTGTINSETQLRTILENYENIGQYMKVSDAKTAVRMGVSVVPTFVVYFRDEKLEQCQGADLSLFRACLDLCDPLRSDRPYRSGAPQGPFPCPTGSLVPIVSTFEKKD